MNTARYIRERRKALLKQKMEGYMQSALIIAGIFLAITSIPHTQAQNVEQQAIISEPVVSATIETVATATIEPVKKMVLVEKTYSEMNIEERKDALRYELASHGVNESDIEIFIKIAQKESNYQEHIEPITWVLHCQRPNKTYYAIEIRNGRQAPCHAGDKEVKREKSYGIFQILPSTARRMCGQKDLTDWKFQVKCAVMVKNKAGFTQWSTYKLVK